MENVLSLIIPFVSLAILSVMVDKFTLFLEWLMEKTPGLPNQLERPIAYLLVFGISFVVCWRGDFSLFQYLNFDFSNPWEGWLMTALVLSGGSAFVRSGFSMVDNIPLSVTSATAGLRRMFITKGENKDETR
ncbi:hypothetical protein [Desulforamulus aquiferis]|uniref:Holin n=1 Tax=Desulforamulus aquiferis TaxID=1397668 RepID=A0AAW7ZCT9_9FIRM|nr:hypothetical protein [Desulforamulus aquiferis]MDO7787108.1 hypothetical protein [Desulforamulus aquiferis]